MPGVVSNVKGIFHEMLVARAENMDEDGIGATLFEAPNHPGADLEFTMNGDVISTVQLKAVQDPTAIVEHFSRHPDIGVMATTEVTELLQGVFGEKLSGSDFNNEEITRITQDTLKDLTREDLGDFVQDGLITSALIGGALQAKALLAGERVQAGQVGSYLELVGVGAGAALTVDTVLNLL